MSSKQKSELHSLLYPGLAISSQISASTTTPIMQQPLDTSLTSLKAFPLPERPLIRRKIDQTSSVEELERWAKEVGLKLGPIVPTTKDREVFLRLLYTYRDLNGGDLTDLPCTNLIVHRVKLLPGTRPVSIKSQKRWPAHTE